MEKKVITKTVTETQREEPRAKKIVRKISGSTKVKEKKMTAREREELLVENFVGLQHAMTNMSIKFGALSDNISRLLEIFEESARNFMQGGDKSDNKDMLNKINSLLDQNKTIAKGLVLMEENLRRRAENPVPHFQETETQPQKMVSPTPKPLPRI